MTTRRNTFSLSSASRCVKWEVRRGANQHGMCLASGTWHVTTATYRFEPTS